MPAPKAKQKKGIENKETFSNTIVRQCVRINIRQFRRGKRENRAAPTKYFRIVTKEEENKADLAEEMAAHTNRLFEEYVPGTEIEVKLLAEALAIANLDKAKQVEGFIVSIPRKTNQCIANDPNLEKFKKKLLNVMDPISIVYRG